MREIKFRAKTSSEINGFNHKKDGIWVYGFYRDKVGLSVISEFDTMVCDYIDYEVDRNTIGQFTGLKDKNGKEIYEGDFIKSKHNTDFYYTYWKDNRFIIEDKWGNRIKPVQRAIDHFECEVVGNYIANPELLEASDED